MKLLLAVLFSLITVSANGFESVVQKHLQPLTSESLPIEKRHRNFMVAVVTPTNTHFMTVGAVQPINQKTMFEAGSITKAILGIVLAQAQLEGKISLDSSFADQSDLRIASYQDKPASWRHLALHTAGLPRLPTNLKPKNQLQPYADYTESSLEEFVSTFQPTREPTAKYEYSNVGAGLVGKGLERIYEMSLESLMIEKVFAPLGMSDTKWTLSAEQQSRMLSGTANGDPVPVWDFSKSALAGAGAVRSTAEDLAKLAQALFVAKPNMIPAMQLATSSGGLFWIVESNGLVWHNGGTYGTRSFLGVNPKTGVGLVVLTNSAVFDSNGVDPAFDLAATNAVRELSKVLSLPRVVSALEQFDNESAALKAKFTLKENIANIDWVKSKLANMYEIDQHMRSASSIPAKSGFTNHETKSFQILFNNRFATIDRENTIVLKAMVKKHGWIKHSIFDRTAANQAWLIAQHADNEPEFQREVLAQLEILWPLNEVQGQHYAMLHDRIAASWSDESKRKLQRYGSQGMCKGSTWEPLPMESPLEVDNRRSLVGLEPMNDYIERVSKFCGVSG